MFSEMLTEVVLGLKKIKSNLKIQLLESLRSIPCMYAWIIMQNWDALIIPTYNYSSWARFSVSWPFGSGTCKHFRLQVKHCNLHRWTNSPCPGFQGKDFFREIPGVHPGIPHFPYYWDTTSNLESLKVWESRSGIPHVKPQETTRPFRKKLPSMSHWSEVGGSRIWTWKFSGNRKMRNIFF